MPSSGTPRFTRALLAPPYWSTWAKLGLVWVLMWLPRRALMRLGAWLGDGMRRANAKRRHIVEVNINLCFPALTPAARHQLLVAHFRSHGQAMVDLGLAMLGPLKRLLRYTDIVGLHHLTDALATGRAIFVNYHTTTLDIGGFAVLAQLDMVTMMKRDKNPVLGWFIRWSRARFGRAKVYMRDQGLRKLIRGLQDGRVCFFVPDEDFGEGRHSISAPFFGQPRAMVNTLGRLAKTTGAVIVPGHCRLDPRSGRYLVRVLPPLRDFPSGDDSTDARRINAVMESLIMAAPEQYLWTFRWFRTAPDGKKLYLR